MQRSLLAENAPEIAAIDAWAELKVWMEDSGATVASGMKVNTTRHGGLGIRGIVVEGDGLHDSQSILSVPKRLWLHMDNFPELHSPFATLENMIPKECDRETLKAGVALALETFKGTASFYHPYLKSLPTLDDYRSYHPRLASTGLLQEFEALDITKSIRALQSLDEHLGMCFASLQNASQAKCQGTEQQGGCIPNLSELTEEDLQLALPRWRTRVYGMADGSAAMIPSSDLLNTAKSELLNTNWRPTSNVFNLTASGRVPGGSEVYDSYCTDCNNAAMLKIWGIYMEDNNNEASNIGSDCESAGLRQVAESILDLHSVNIHDGTMHWNAPRCKQSPDATAQGPMRCSFARLAWETCADIWLHRETHQQQDKELGDIAVLGQGSLASMSAEKIASLIDQSAIHRVPKALWSIDRR